MLCKHDNLTIEEKVALIEGHHVWCWSTFWIGIAVKLQRIVFSRELIVFIIITYVFLSAGSIDNTAQWFGYIAVGIVFIFAEALRILIANNTKVDISARAVFGKELNNGNNAVRA